jgi:CTP-dependent riboflavin kinase
LTAASEFFRNPQRILQKERHIGRKGRLTEGMSDGTRFGIKLELYLQKGKKQ